MDETANSAFGLAIVAVATIRGFMFGHDSGAITVNSVSPGSSTRRWRDVPLREQLPGLRRQIAAACCFLASDEAGYITAQVLGVNGGAAT